MSNIAKKTLPPGSHKATAGVDGDQGTARVDFGSGSKSKTQVLDENDGFQVQDHLLASRLDQGHINNGSNVVGVLGDMVDQGHIPLPDESVLVDVVPIEEVTQCIENAKVELNPLLGLLNEPLFQTLVAVALLLNGVLGLVFRLLRRLGLGGLLDGLLGALGVNRVIEGLDPGHVTKSLTGGDMMEVGGGDLGGGLFGGGK